MPQPLLTPPPLTGSTVDVVVRAFGSSIGEATNRPVNSGSVDISAEESSGVFTSASFTEGSFTVLDTSIPLAAPLAGNSLESTGLGFSIQPSTFSLTPTTGNTYSVTGTLFLRADQGTAAVLPLGFVRDFSSIPGDYSVSLTNSFVTITPTGGGEYSYTGDFRFPETVIETVLGTYTVGISSLNTISVSGDLAPIPEPNSAILVLIGSVIALRRKR